MTSSRPPVLAEAALLGASEASSRANEAVHGLAAPESAFHHQRHLREAAAALNQACASALLCLGRQASESEREALLRALHAASDHLRLTAQLIPGFELVDLGQACCAAHGPQRLLCET